MHWNGYRILLALPQTLDGSALVIAADRAGALGILDGTEPRSRERSIGRMNAFGVRSYAVGVEPDQVARDWIEQAGQGLVAVVCTASGTPAALSAACSTVKSTRRV